MVDSYTLGDGTLVDELYCNAVFGKYFTLIEKHPSGSRIMDEGTLELVWNGKTIAKFGYDKKKHVIELQELNPYVYDERLQSKV